MSLKTILELSSLHGFFKIVKRASQEIPEFFHFGPAGELLAQNIQKEWIYSNATAREPNSVFQHHSPLQECPSNSYRHLKEAFSLCKSLTNGQLPFGLVEVRGTQEVQPALVIQNESHNRQTVAYATGGGTQNVDIDCSVPTDETKYETLQLVDDDIVELTSLLPRVRHPLRYYAFTSAHEGAQFFYRWQQHRHMCWRKFSMDPGRFSLVERNEDGVESKGAQIVDIKVEFPWGSMTVETIRNHGQDFFNDLQHKDLDEVHILDSRKRGLPYVLESYCTQEAAVLAYLCDGYSEPKVLGVPRQQFILHRHLAPFKISFAAAPSTGQNAIDINDLATYLGQMLRVAGISTLPPHLKRSLDAQLKRCDSLAVPYTLILTPSTLTSGIALLRSQQTSTQEEVHTANLVSYIEQLTKNY